MINPFLFNHKVPANLTPIYVDRDKDLPVGTLVRVSSASVDRQYDGRPMRPTVTEYWRDRQQEWVLGTAKPTYIWLRKREQGPRYR